MKFLCLFFRLCCFLFLSSAREYLTSAGNRMTRRQLRTCLKDVRTLHQEFLVSKLYVHNVKSWNMFPLLPFLSILTLWVCLAKVRSKMKWKNVSSFSSFQDIPLNHPAKLDLPGASNKNRYKSIWPNDETRVKLVDNDGDEYINANYIRVRMNKNETKAKQFCYHNVKLIYIKWHWSVLIKEHSRKFMRRHQRSTDDVTRLYLESKTPFFFFLSNRATTGSQKFILEHKVH